MFLFLLVLRADLTPWRLEKLTASCHISHVCGSKQPVTCLLQVFTKQFSKPEGKEKIQSVTVLKLRNASLSLGNLSLKYESVNLSFIKNLGNLTKIKMIFMKNFQMWNQTSAQLVQFINYWESEHLLCSVFSYSSSQNYMIEKPHVFPLKVSWKGQVGPPGLLIQ